ncbi:2-dehydropantoate 2-reductase [Desertivibrio insolitus]|uniref:2-dehydropantoate 2-reductase n=1 Tax=Herbiconiux sp. SYSU D00978 TaxID=2812562 RepID=UPI001A95684D|nr:2-dehydropantoate 2-reductase [Herbiconiux sp. SYSU D00978]
MTSRILVLGAGATGGFFGGRMAEAGRDVTFLARAERAERLRRDGLVLRSPRGESTVRPPVLTAGELAEPFDLVLVTVKAYSLAAALDDVAPAIGESTAVVPILNGLAQLDLLAARYGEERVLPGSVVINARLDDDGAVVQGDDLARFTYGERSGERTPRVLVLDAAATGCGFDAVLSDDILTALWQKWVFLATLGAVTCLGGAPLGRVVAAPHGRALAEGVLAEVAAVAAAAGHPADAAQLDRVRSSFTPESQATTSMYRDWRAGRPTEADHILGDLVRRAHGFGVPVSLLEAAHTVLAVHEAAR